MVTLVIRYGRKVQLVVITGCERDKASGVKTTTLEVLASRHKETGSPVAES